MCLLQIKKTALWLLALTLLAAPASFAQDDKQKPAGNESDKLDVSDLEKKYWAAKDTDFNVVQNRIYTKANRLTLTGGYGMLIGDSYSDGQILGVGTNYYFNDRYGIELSYNKINSSNNDQTEGFLNTYGVLPNHNKQTSFYGGAFNWVPFYAKMSFLGMKILYFDMAFSPGLGMTTYEQQLEAGNIEKQALTFTFDVSQHIFLSKHFAIRLDYKNHWFQEEVREFRSTAPYNNMKIKDQTNHTSILMFGATFYF
jgi:outer membrane beta-barrel protein